jgi:prepilin-type N-terminal cleavage/methylation domain-containing protein
MHRHGFTLLELSMVLVITGLMLGFLTQMGSTVNKTDCYATTRTQVTLIEEAIDRFARKNDRLPMPAARNIGIENINYGREALAAAIDQAGGVSFGAIPFQALGLAPSLAGDCWGNKFTYMVTTALTTNASSGGYLDATVLGNIARKSAAGTTTDSAVAYAVVSHGADEYGAVELNYAGVSKGWCAVASTLKSMNCRASTAELGDAVYNDGKDAAANFFDDVVIAAGKPKILIDKFSNAYCWGANSAGQLGDSTTTQRTSPTRTKGEQTFIAISNGSTHTCALNTEGKAYCWGENTYGALGIGVGGGTKTIPTAVAGGFTFVAIEAGDQISCALTAAGAAYCWGYNGGAALGLGHGATPVTTPAAVTGGLTFASISADFGTVCGVTTAGVGYCWGDGTYGRVGDNNTASHVQTSPRAVDNSLSGPVTYRQIQTGGESTCGLATDGKLYCWGRNHWGQLGDSTTTNRGIPTEVAGGHLYRQLATSGVAACALTTTGTAYCWGSSQTAGNCCTNYTTPQLIAGHTFERISSAGGYGSMCAFKTDNSMYCWGINSAGQLADGTTTNHYTPTAVPGYGTTPLFFGAMPWGGAGNAGHFCALQPVAASWGENAYGQVGDGTTTDRATPVYIKMPSGMNYFTLTRASAVGSGTTRCGIGDDGKAYCWGENNCGQVGDGTRVDKPSPAAVPLPTGVTSFKAISPGDAITCAIGNNDKVYCWGRGDVCGGASPNAPTEIALPSLTALGIDDGYAAASALGSNGLLYTIDSALGNTLVPYTNDASSPALPAAAKGLGRGGDGVKTCILGSDDQIYCNGETLTYGSLGDGSAPTFTPTPAGAFVKVTNPGGVASFKTLSVGHVSGGWSFACAIGNNDQAYCWGHCGDPGICGNGNEYLLETVPTLVTLPAGVTSWQSLNVGSAMVTAIGNDGNAYYWGSFWAEWTGTPGYVGVNLPTKIPLPMGATGYLSVYGRTGLVF